MTSCRFSLGLAILAVFILVNRCVAFFSVDHDLYSTPQFVIGNDTLRYLLETQLASYLQSVKQLTDLEVEIMKFKNETYVCTIPVLKEKELVTEDSQEMAKWDEKMLARAKDYAIRMLQPMSKQCLSYMKDWWTYSFCYGEDVRQFHLDEAFLASNQLPEPGKGVMSFILGKFARHKNGDLKISAQIHTEGEPNYLAYTLKQGTLCDLTGEDRSIEVHFYCNPDRKQDTIMGIKEVKSCEYQIAIQTPRICGNPVFAPPAKVEAHRIECKRVLKLSDVEGWKQAQQQTAHQKKEEAAQAKKKVFKKTETKPSTGSLDKKEPPAVEAGKPFAGVLYNDREFENNEPMSQIQLDPRASADKHLDSYVENIDHTLGLLLEKVSAMIKSGQFKNANGKVIGVKDQFATVMELLDLDGQSILHVRIELTEGDLIVEILNEEGGDEDDDFENVAFDELYEDPYDPKQKGQKQKQEQAPLPPVEKSADSILEDDDDDDDDGGGDDDDDDDDLEDGPITTTITILSTITPPEPVDTTVYSTADEGAVTTTPQQQHQQQQQQRPPENTLALDSSRQQQDPLHRDEL